jgi:membrane protein implicated in regulation of membrane protease activity
MDAWIWFVAAGLLLVAEILTANLLFASLALAALAAGLTNALGASMAVQGVSFALFAIISFAFLRPIALRHLKRQNKDSATNVDALVGQKAFVTAKVNALGGQIKLAGEIWSARSDADEIKKDEEVEVIAIEGATARVRKV